MNSAEPRGKEETGEGRAVGAGRGCAPAGARSAARRLVAASRGGGRVPFSSGVRRLRDRFRGRRWEEPGGPGSRPRGLLLLRPRARLPPPWPLISDPRPPWPGLGRAPSALRPNRYFRVSPPAPRRPSEAQSLFRLLGLFPAASPA